MSEREWELDAEVEAGREGASAREVEGRGGRRGRGEGGEAGPGRGANGGSNAVGRKNHRMHFFVPSSPFCSPIYFAMRQKDAVVPIAGRK